MADKKEKGHTPGSSTPGTQGQGRTNTPTGGKRDERDTTSRTGNPGAGTTGGQLGKANEGRTNTSPGREQGTPLGQRREEEDDTLGQEGGAGRTTNTERNGNPDERTDGDRKKNDSL